MIRRLFWTVLFYGMVVALVGEASAVSEELWQSWIGPMMIYFGTSSLIGLVLLSCWINGVPIDKLLFPLGLHEEDEDEQ